MAEQPPAYSEGKPSVPIQGGYQPQPQSYGATPSATAYHGAPYSGTHNTVGRMHAALHRVCHPTSHRCVLVFARWWG